jgi:hypothetical protein
MTSKPTWNQTTVPFWGTFPPVGLLRPWQVLGYWLLLLTFLASSLGAQEPVKEKELFVDVSVTGGFYDTPQRLVMDCPGAEIYYTTTGDVPNPANPDHRYTEPIVIRSTTAVRFFAQAGDRRSPLLSHTYFIGEPKTEFQVISLVIPPYALFHPDKGLFVKGPDAIDSLWKMPGANFWSRAELPMNVEIFGRNGACVFRNGAGFRLFGGMSRLFPQKSMVLAARSRYGDKRINYPLFGKDGLDKFKFLVLRNSGSDFGKAHFRDALMTSLVKDWDLDVQDEAPSHVYINGQYWGVYHIREKINRYFIAAHHDIDKDSIDLMEHRYTRKRGSRIHYLEMLRFLENANLADPTQYAYLQTQMDIENFMNYQIAQIYFDNQDAGGNIRYWRPKTSDGRWRWILYDTDWGFGLHESQAYKNNSLAFHTEPDGPAWPNPPWSTFILRKLMMSREFQFQFVNTFCDHLNWSFHPRTVEDRIDFFQQQLEGEIYRHFDRWDLSPKEWYDQIEIMREFARHRPEHVRMHLMERFDLGRERQLVVNAQGQGEVVINNNIHIGEADDFSGVYFEKLPIRLEAVPRLGYRFSHWEGIDLDQQDRQLTLLLTEPQLQIRAVFEKYDHPLAGQIIINEISCNNRASEDWVELYNQSDILVNMKGWSFTDSRNQFTFPEVVLPPQGYLVVCENQESFLKEFPDAYRTVGDMDFGLNKRREELGLFTPDGALIDQFKYRLPPTDSVFTLNLLLPYLDNGDQENWEMLTGGGSPNVANRYYVLSTLNARRELWLEVGGALGVILICMILLVLRQRGRI